jgi:excisionase family DNA binding protein
MEKLLSFEEAQTLTGIRIPTWRAWAAKRKVPVVRLGRRIKLRESDLQKFIESNLVPSLPDRAR